MIDPKFMDEQLGIDRSKLADRYKQVQEPQQQPVEEPQFDVDLSYGNMSEDEYNDFQAEDEQEDVRETFEQEPQRNPVNPENVERKKQEQRPPKLSRPGKSFKTDRPYFEGFEGSPLESEVLGWKKQFGRVYATELEGEIFVWRTINRFEYKEVMSIPNTNELSREEMICEVCVLFPYDYSYETMVNDAGGIPSMIAEQVMQKSGFTRKARVIAL